MKNEENYFKHEKAIVESDSIGVGTRIWANAHIMKDAVIGERCNIGEGCFIESGVRIGDDVVIKNNISIWLGIIIEDGVFLGPNVVFTNEIEPRSTFPKELARTLIKRGATIGANSTIIANRIVGEFSTIGAGSVVTKDVLPHRLVYGNPARIHGWVCICGRKLTIAKFQSQCICGREYHIEQDNFRQIK
ncbi:MAG: N-acetyltransferase [Bacteroidetes bacterium]|nr:N-acetyltransferase [Bacteroidota bacterium]